MNQRLLFTSFAAVLCIQCGNRDAATKEDPKPGAATASASAVATVPPAPPPKVKTLSDQAEEAKTLADALKITVPAMGDIDSKGRSPEGMIALLSWAHGGNLKWAELMALPETKFAVVKKDSEEQRGKRICPAGKIIEIKKQVFMSSKIYDGGMGDISGDVFRFVAVGSTGDIVQGSTARFCGVVIGNKSYANSGGGTTHAVQLVGMFDLPENTGKKAPLRFAHRDTRLSRILVDHGDHSIDRRDVPRLVAARDELGEVIPTHRRAAEHGAAHARKRSVRVDGELRGRLRREPRPVVTRPRPERRKKPVLVEDEVDGVADEVGAGDARPRASRVGPLHPLIDALDLFLWDPNVDLDGRGSVDGHGLCHSAKIPTNARTSTRRALLGLRVGFKWLLSTLRAIVPAGQTDAPATFDGDRRIAGKALSHG